MKTTACQNRREMKIEMYLFMKEVTNGRINILESMIGQMDQMEECYMI